MSIEAWDPVEAGAAILEAEAVSPDAVSELTVSDIKGIPVHRRKGVEQAVIAGADGLTSAYEAWVVAARKPPAYSVRVVGPRGFYLEVRFTGPETDAEVEHAMRRAIQSRTVATPTS